MLELQNISFGVSESQGKKEILKDISLTVGENKFVVITGPNGEMCIRDILQFGPSLYLCSPVFQCAVRDGDV